jgi:hypothetical protein
MRSASFAQTLAPRRATASLAAPTLAAVLGLLAGIVLVLQPQLIALVIAAVLAVVGISLAFSRPALAFGGLVLLAAFVPSYASPAAGPLLVIPAAAASWLLAVALGWRNLIERGRLFRPNVVDLAFGLFALAMIVSSMISPRTGRDELLHVMFLWAGPYLGCRLLLADVKRPLLALAASFGIATAVLAPFAIAEYLGASNVFHNFDFNSTEFQTWAGQANRFGQTRAEASFGHPIALSMFAAASALLSLTMAVTGSRGRERNLWLASAALAVAVQVLTVSRTGWLMMVIGGVAMVFFFARGENRRRLVLIAASVGTAILIASVVAPSALQILPGFEKKEAEVQGSGQYREKLVERALEPGVLHAWGNARNEVTPYVNHSLGTATDNAYILLADTWGLIPTFTLFLVGGALLWVAFRSRWRQGEGLLIVPVVAFAAMAVLMFVAFITQQQVMIWLLVGAAAAAAERLAITAPGGERSAI